MRKKVHYKSLFKKLCMTNELQNTRINQLKAFNSVSKKPSGNLTSNHLFFSPCISVVNVLNHMNESKIKSIELKMLQIKF